MRGQGRGQGDPLRSP